MWVVEGSIAYKKLSLNLIVMSFFAKLILNISFRVCEKFYLFLNDHWFRTKERLEGIATWNTYFPLYEIQPIKLYQIIKMNILFFIYMASISCCIMKALFTIICLHLFKLLENLEKYLRSNQKYLNMIPSIQKKVVTWHIVWTLTKYHQTAIIVIRKWKWITN